MAERTPFIDMDRLRALLDGVNTFGADPATGGYNRIGFSEADMAVRRWFKQQLAADGFAVSQDAAANIFGRYGPVGAPSIMVGSHLDTVPDGGAFDGSLGVCVGLECLCALRDAGITPTIPIEVVATAEEEGRFGGMLGSQAITGQLAQDWIDVATDPDGLTLTDAMRAEGLDPDDLMSAARPPGSILAFLELHIEQGPLLEAASLPIGIAHAVSGVCHLAVRFKGKANHSGTTPMALRADAFAGLAEVAGSISAVIDDQGTEQSRITIGKVDLQPNFPHTIPGSADFSIIIRDTDEAVMRKLVEELNARIRAAARHHRLEAAVAERSWLSPVTLDAELANLLVEEAARLNIGAMTMPSGAGHDAQTMQAFCPAALIFVPSRGGVSHSPEEWTDWPEIEQGARLMLSALHRLAVTP